MQPARSLLIVCALAASAAPLAAQTPGPGGAAAARRLVLHQAQRMADQALASLASDGTDECDLVADIAEFARVHALLEELALSAASCVNEESSTEAKFEACLQEAFEAYAEGLEELEEQTAARLDLCALTGGGIYDPDLDEDDFEADVDNKFLPFAVGSTWVYHQQTDEGLEEDVTTVLEKTKDVDGIESIVVHDIVTLDGVILEDTFDWYSQHEDGTVWYMGEISQSFEDGELVSLDGSWKAGEEGALPGIVMLAHPTVGVTYRQELRLTEAEDAATVLALDATAVVPFGTFTGCLKTEDFSPLEPGAVEHKYYAKNVGLVLEVNPATGERLELISFSPGH
jgi:hypothetical protein